MENQTEAWKSHPEYTGTEVSSFGRVRMLDRVVSSEKMTRFQKGQISKQYDNRSGYLNVSIPIDGKWTTKAVHRLVAQTFLPNPNGFPMVNHKDGNRANNHIDNLEFCTASYNAKYREEFGKALSKPVFTINLATLEVSQFQSQKEASQELGVNKGNISSVIKGRLKQTGGYWFINADGKAVDLTKQKLRDIGETKLTAADEASADFVSKIISE